MHVTPPPSHCPARHSGSLGPYLVQHDPNKPDPNRSSVCCFCLPRCRLTRFMTLGLQDWRLGWHQLQTVTTLVRHTKQPSTPDIRMKDAVELREAVLVDILDPRVSAIQCMYCCMYLTYRLRTRTCPCRRGKWSQGLRAMSSTWTNVATCRIKLQGLQIYNFQSAMIASQLSLELAGPMQ